MFKEHCISENNIVLIFDECTSGFRETFGGLHIKYGVQPDLAVFGKAIGNGYALTAVIGKRAVMEHAQSSFISSTFWTERIGFLAGIKIAHIEAGLRTNNLEQPFPEEGMRQLISRIANYHFAPTLKNKKNNWL